MIIENIYCSCQTDLMLTWNMNNKWWLFTTLANSSIKDHSSQLHIFSSENILSDKWEPHRKNPVIFDP